MTKKLADVTKDLKLDPATTTPMSAAEVVEYEMILRAQLLEQEVARGEMQAQLMEQEIERGELQIERDEECHEMDVDQRPIYMALEAIKILGHLRTTTIGGQSLSSGGAEVNNINLLSAIDAKLIELIGFIEIEEETTDENQ